MRDRSRVGAVLCAWFLVSSLVLGCRSTPDEVSTQSPSTAAASALPTGQVSPTAQVPTQAPSAQASATLAPTSTPTAEAATQAPATQPPATQPPTATATASPVPQAGPELYDDQESPAALLASYVNAINRREYERAWSYWESPPNQSFEEFRQGFADTRSVLLAVRPPAWFGAAAGSTYAPMSTLLLATHADGSQQNFRGCYVARRQNVDPAGDSRWWLYDALVSPSPDNGSGAGLLVDACEQVPPPGPTEPAYDDQGSPAALLASYANALNRREYERAWAYWENPPNPSFEDFQQGYEGTDEVFIVVSPPTHVEGAAGSMYASVPVILMATNATAGRQSFVGCYDVRRSNVDDSAPQWFLNGATMRAVTGTSPDTKLLAGACPGE